MENKLSFFTIITEPVDETGNRVLLSTRTNKLLLVPNLTYTCLVNNSISEIPEVVVAKLKKILAVVPKEEDELLSVINENREEIQNYDKDVLYEVIQPSAMCQLDCYYCGQNHTNMNMSSLIIGQLISRIRLKVSNGSYKKMFIAWFGGEPLMALKEIRKITIELKKLCDEFGLEYSCKMVSNGYALSESVFLELARDLNLTQIEITIDGTKPFHDSHRYTKLGKGSFDKIFENLSTILRLKDFQSFNCKISIRCNVDENNHESVLPLIKLLAEENLHNNINFYTIGVHNWGNDARKIALEEKMYAVNELIWLKKMYELGFNVKILPKRNKHNCVALSKTSDVYDAFGNIFNCTEIPYVPKYYKSHHVLGSITTSFDKFDFTKPFIDWNDRLSSENYLCKDCNLLPVCGGACPKSWSEGVSPCPSIKHNIKERLMLFFLFMDRSSMDDFLKKVECFIN